MLFFCVKLLLLSITFLKFIMLHVLTICSLLLLRSTELDECATICVSHSTMGGQVRCFQFGTFMNKVAINIIITSLLGTQEYLRLGVFTWGTKLDFWIEDFSKYFKEISLYPLNLLSRLDNSKKAFIHFQPFGQGSTTSD